MTRLELSDRFARMYRQTREDAGKSQEYMAKALGVSKKTVQNWEDGTSAPNMVKGFEWFEILHLQPLPYFLDALYPGRFDHDFEDDSIMESIITIISQLPLDAKKKLLFILSGNHGSSGIGMIELAVAHLHVPLDRRINIAQSVATNYELSEYQNCLVCPDQVRPNMETLHRSIDLGKRAVIKGEPSYTIDVTKTEGE